MFDFLCYVTRFIFLIWAELPLYFLQKQKRGLAIRTLVSELSTYAVIGLLARFHFRATLFVLIIPLVQMRIGMMVGNWGQHALVDELEPDSDFRSSITLIDVPVRFASFPCSSTGFPSRKAQSTSSTVFHCFLLSQIYTCPESLEYQQILGVIHL